MFYINFTKDFIFIIFFYFFFFDSFSDIIINCLFATIAKSKIFFYFIFIFKS